MQPTETCIGCGAVLLRIEGPTHRYMTSAPGCWALFGELTAHIYGSATLPARCQLCVDAFAVQHPGSANPQAVASVAIHLQSL